MFNTRDSYEVLITNGVFTRLRAASLATITSNTKEQHIANMEASLRHLDLDLRKVEFYLNFPKDSMINAAVTSLHQEGTVAEPSVLTVDKVLSFSEAMDKQRMARNFDDAYKEQKDEKLMLSSADEAQELIAVISAAWNKLVKLIK